MLHNLSLDEDINMDAIVNNENGSLGDNGNQDIIRDSPAGDNYRNYVATTLHI